MNLRLSDDDEKSDGQKVMTCPSLCSYPDLVKSIHRSHIKVNGENFTVLKLIDFL
jgi:hypothetical protein